jgi:eukaryotic-like serine/threonine-protein kinase
MDQAGEQRIAERERRLICPPLPHTTPAGVKQGRGRRRLPDDLVRQASRRLEAIALLAAGLWIFCTILYHLIDLKNAGSPNWMSLQPTDALVGGGAVMSLGLFFYLRQRPRDPRVVLDLGLVFLVATAAIIGQILHWSPLVHTATTPMFSWIGILMLMFAATLPNDPYKTAVAGLLAVSMNPIGMLIARARGAWPFESAWTAWTMHYPDFLLVMVSLVIARVVTGLGHQVARAREMGSYELGDRIGQGGMGEVYKAKHRMLARPAAIKLIRPELLAQRNGEQAEIAIQRFHREATAAAQLRSPHTVGLYDFGTTDDGTLYFAMELLDGMTLEAMVEQTGPLTPARVIHILRQVCDSLAEAHASGMVHRDIKPANIHIGRFGLRDDFVKVLDFGLVTSGPTVGGSHLATLVGTIPGTPAYMAPEMALGEPVDGRADIYALGCVAYYLLTGQLVFESENAMHSLMKRLNEPPAPPSTRTELPIPVDLEAIVLACLERQAEKRPATAGELAARLAAVAVAPWTDEQARRWWSVHFPETVSPSTSRPSAVRDGSTAIATPRVNVV